MPESPDDVMERMARRADAEFDLEWRAWNSLEALMVKIPDGMRQRMLRQACERYGVNRPEHAALEQLRRCNRVLGCEHDYPEDCIKAAVALARDGQGSSESNDG